MIDPNKVKPVSDRLLIKPDPVAKEEKGIIVPDAAKQKSVTGEVLAVGPTVWDKIVVGCKVRYSEHSGTEIGAGYLLMPENQILCIIEK